jgi:hypothetical protein
VQCRLFHPLLAHLGIGAPHHEPPLSEPIRTIPHPPPPRHTGPEHPFALLARSPARTPCARSRQGLGSCRWQGRPRSPASPPWAEPVPAVALGEPLAGRGKRQAGEGHTVAQREWRDQAPDSAERRPPVRVSGVPATQKRGPANGTVGPAYAV